MLVLKAVHSVENKQGVPVYADEIGITEQYLTAYEQALPYPDPEGELDIECMFADVANSSSDNPIVFYLTPTEEQEFWILNMLNWFEDRAGDEAKIEKALLRLTRKENKNK